MSVSPVSNTDTSIPTVSSSSNGALTQSQFYQIIVAQLKNQDPQNATDTNALVQDTMSLANYQATQQSATAVTSMKNYLTAVSLVGANVDVTVPATAMSASQSVSGTVTKASFGNSGAAVTVGGTEYLLDYVTDVNQPAAAAAAAQ